MSIVSNSSALINLARIGRLNILQQLYVEVTIPEAVWHEVVVKGAGQLGADTVKDATWIKTTAVTNKQLVHALRQELDAGEAEAITLAQEIGAELLLMDYHLGRQTAHYLGLRYSGLIGVLIEAKKKGLFSSIKPQIDKLREVAGFRISKELYLRVLQDEGET
jgi:predicted nucleic acid-binding protein